MRTIILGGFLGSGKTTFLLQLVDYLANVESIGRDKIFIIENEIGETSVDDKLISGKGYQVSTMFAGCACCTIKGQLESGVRELIEDHSPEVIIVEASGVAHPKSMKENLVQTLKIDCRICILVDAKRWLILMRGVAALLENQIDEADIILVNKIDQVDDEQVKQVAESLQGFGATEEVEFISATHRIDSQILAKVIGKYR